MKHFLKEKKKKKEGEREKKKEQDKCVVRSSSSSKMLREKCDSGSLSPAHLQQIHQRYHSLGRESAILNLTVEISSEMKKTTQLTQTNKQKNPTNKPKPKQMRLFEFKVLGNSKK